MPYIHYDRGSVYLPGNLGEKKDLPVVFWIHGYLFTRSFIHRQLWSYHFVYSQGAGISQAMRPSSMVMI
jgi:dipeptidyl aminopeptidase/acylaminoacyl peptidase